MPNKKAQKEEAGPPADKKIDRELIKISANP
jgi:hypothetical protein